MSRHRDRRGRGMRGPVYGPFQPGDPGRPRRRTPAARFDDVALAVMSELWERFPAELGGVQLGVEEVPLLPDAWSPDSVPLASYVAGRGDLPARLVLLRRPIEHRAANRGELEALLLTVLVEQVAEILGLSPEQVHPDYPGGD